MSMAVSSDLPIIGLNDVKHVGYKAELVKLAQSATTSEGLDEIGKLADSQMATYNSILGFCKQSSVDFKKAMKLMEKDDAAAAQLEEQKRKEMQERQEAEQRAAALSDAKATSAAAFHGKYKECGHPQINVYPTMQSAYEFLAQGFRDPFDPFVVDCKVVFDSMTKTKVTMGQWETAMKAKCTRSGSIYEEASMTEKMGLGEVKQVMDMFPKEFLSTNFPPNMESFFAGGPCPNKPLSK